MIESKIKKKIIMFFNFDDKSSSAIATGEQSCTRCFFNCRSGIIEPARIAPRFEPGTLISVHCCLSFYLIYIFLLKLASYSYPMTDGF
jgi:hypothetical protein